MLDILKYEEMAKLELPENEREVLRGRLEEMLNGFEALDELDVKNTEPLVSVLDLRNITREDKCVKAFTLKELLENAPDSSDGYFQAPKTLE